MKTLAEWEAADIYTKARSFIALAMEGSPFRSYACREIMDLLRLRKGLSWECCYWCLVSAAAREDRETMAMYVRDWIDPSQRPSYRVKKFQPGEHWHTLGKKFDNFYDATQYAEGLGYVYAGQEIIRIHSGD